MRSAMQSIVTAIINKNAPQPKAGQHGQYPLQAKSFFSHTPGLDRPAKAIRACQQILEKWNRLIYMQHPCVHDKRHRMGSYTDTYT